MQAKKRLTVQMLRKWGASCDQVGRFEKEFGQWATICEANIRRAEALQLDLDYFAAHYLASSALEAYEKAIASAWEAYEKAIAPAEEAYEKAIASALEAHRKAIASALITALGLKGGKE